MLHEADRTSVAEVAKRHGVTSDLASLLHLGKVRPTLAPADRTKNSCANGQGTVPNQR